MDAERGPFAQLLAIDGVVETLELRSRRIGFMAFHGGNLEVGTDRIAAAAAAEAGASLYTVCQPPPMRWHIPSVRFTPAESQSLAAFVDHVGVAVTLHGYGRWGLFTALLLGGRNRVLAEHFGGHLRNGLGDYDVITDVDAIPRKLRGMHAANPVNLPRAAGVQIELPPRVRGNGPFWQTWQRGWPVPHTSALIDALAEGAASWT